MSKILAFLGAVPGSIAGCVNAEELERAVYASGAAGALATAASLALGAVLADAAAIFPGPATSSLAVWGLTFLLELLRRMGHQAPPPVGPGA